MLRDCALPHDFFPHDATHPTLFIRKQSQLAGCVVWPTRVCPCMSRMGDTQHHDVAPFTFTHTQAHCPQSNGSSHCPHSHGTTWHSLIFIYTSNLHLHLLTAHTPAHCSHAYMPSCVCTGNTVVLAQRGALWWGPASTMCCFSPALQPRSKPSVVTMCM